MGKDRNIIEDTFEINFFRNSDEFYDPLNLLNRFYDDVYKNM